MEVKDGIRRVNGDGKNTVLQKQKKKVLDLGYIRFLHSKDW